jgi:hypothetical protein
MGTGSAAHHAAKCGALRWVRRTACLLLEQRANQR